MNVHDAVDMTTMEMVCAMLCPRYRALHMYAITPALALQKGPSSSLLHLLHPLPNLTPLLPVVRHDQEELGGAAAGRGR